MIYNYIQRQLFCNYLSKSAMFLYTLSILLLLTTHTEHICQIVKLSLLNDCWLLHGKQIPHVFKHWHLNRYLKCSFFPLPHILGGVE